MSGTTTQAYQGSHQVPSVESAKVADAMRPGLVTCEPDATLREVAQTMVMHDVHCIAIMGISETPPGEPLAWATISDLDLIVAAGDYGPDTPVGTVAMQPTITLAPDAPLGEAIGLMLVEGATYAVVSDPLSQRPAGVISTLDIVRIVAWGEG